MESKLSPIKSFQMHSAKLILCEEIVGGSRASYDDVIERSLVQDKVKFDGVGLKFVYVPPQQCRRKKRSVVEDILFALGSEVCDAFRDWSCQSSRKNLDVYS